MTGVYGNPRGVRHAPPPSLAGSAPIAFPLSCAIMPSPPLIGITLDVVETDHRKVVNAGLAYAERVSNAGGVPVFLAPIAARIPEYLRTFDAFVFTGGDDPKMEPFGITTHPKAKPLHPIRQEFEVGLLKSLSDRRPHAPVLGVCLGMQLMTLLSGGKMDQHLPDSLASHEHHKHHAHPVFPCDADAARLIPTGQVWSNHRQAMLGAGLLRVIAKSDDGVIEAVDDPARPFYVGVQWHPERTEDSRLGQGLFDALVRATRD